jgi:hypothetical protein
LSKRQATRNSRSKLKRVCQGPILQKFKRVAIADNQAC